VFKSGLSYNYNVHHQNALYLSFPAVPIHPVDMLHNALSLQSSVDSPGLGLSHHTDPLPA